MFYHLRLETNKDPTFIEKNEIINTSKSNGDQSRDRDYFSKILNFHGSHHHPLEPLIFYLYPHLLMNT